MSYQLAAVNTAIAKYEYDNPAFAGFVDNLDRINALADGSAGFVWRYISDDDDAEAKRVFADDRVIFNMSVWESIEDLRSFVYDSGHVEILRQRAAWFIPQDRPSMALWWQPSGSIPSIVEAKHRMDCLAVHGPSEDAFTFRNEFDPPLTAPGATGAANA